MKKVLISVILTALAISAIAYAGSIKAWNSREAVTASDLNANFSHIHNLMVGGHGARLVDSDVNASAAIAHSKMATPALLPKAWAFVTGPCAGGGAAGTACTLGDSSQVTAVAANGTTGQYQLKLNYQPTNVNFAVFVTAGTANVLCTVGSLAAGAAGTVHAVVTCKNDGVAGADAPTDSVLSIMVMDT